MQQSEFDPSRVENHYARRDLCGTILAALAEAGKDLDNLKPEDLAPVDEFHIRGRHATLDLARKIELDEKMQVLDVGSGLGGVSRYLALEFGCHVTGLDLSGEYCRVADMLTRRLGLASRVSCRQGNALDMPFGDASFDLLWSQHATMNIPDKAGLWAEMWRVLRPGGVVAVHEILAGRVGSVHFPVPWARDPSLNFLITPQQMRDILEETGFEIASWRDATEESRLWFRRIGEKISRQGSPSIGLHLLLGPEFKKMAENQVRNLEEGRITVVESILRRPSNPDSLYSPKGVSRVR